MKVAYIVSHFPHVTETFVLRELNGVDTGTDLELFSLFPTSTTRCIRRSATGSRS